MAKADGNQIAFVAILHGAAASFYRAMGFGRSIKEAFDQGKTALLLERIPEENIPELVTRHTIKPGSIVLIPPIVVTYKYISEFGERLTIDFHLDGSAEQSNRDTGTWTMTALGSYTLKFNSE